MSDCSKNSSCLKQIWVFQKDEICVTVREYFRIEKKTGNAFYRHKNTELLFQRVSKSTGSPLDTSLQY